MSCTIRVYGHQQYVSVICTCRDCDEGRPCRRQKPFRAPPSVSPLTSSPPLLSSAPPIHQSCPQPPPRPPSSSPPPLFETPTSSPRSLLEGSDSRFHNDMWQRSFVNPLSSLRAESCSGEASAPSPPRPASRLSCSTQDSEASSRSRAASDPERGGEWFQGSDPPRSNRSFSATLDGGSGSGRVGVMTEGGRNSLPATWHPQEASVSQKMQDAFNHRLQDAYQRAMTESFSDPR